MEEIESPSETGKYDNLKRACAPRPTANMSTALFVLDNVSNVKFLVDSGADVSLFPASPEGRPLQPAPGRSQWISNPLVWDQIPPAPGSHIPVALCGGQRLPEHPGRQFFALTCPHGQPPSTLRGK